MFCSPLQIFPKSKYLKKLTLFDSDISEKMKYVKLKKIVINIFKNRKIE